VGEALAGQLTGSIEELAQFLEGFSMSQIIIALMLMAAMNKDDDKSGGGGGAATGFLAGMAMAGLGGQQQTYDFSTPVPDVGMDSGAGTNLNTTA
jgi:hypothetical protein